MNYIISVDACKEFLPTKYIYARLSWYDATCDKVVIKYDNLVIIITELSRDKSAQLGYTYYY